jgi:hypothetical protein
MLPHFLGAGIHAYRVDEDGDPIPPDATIVAARMSFDGEDLELRVASAEWPDVPEGEVLPEIRPTMRTVGVWERITQEQGP